VDSSIEDRYFERIEQILGIKFPKPGETRVFMLELPELETTKQAKYELDDLGFKQQQLSGLSDEIGQAEAKYNRRFFGDSWKATQCRAVLMTLAQIQPTLRNMEFEVQRWIDEQKAVSQVRALCTQCGSAVLADAVFCSKCGHPIADAKSQLP
jgi:hypothetical protein